MDDIESLVSTLRDQGFRRIVLSGPPVSFSFKSDGIADTIVEWAGGIDAEIISDLRREGFKVALMTDRMDSEGDRLEAHVGILTGGKRHVENPFADVVVKSIAELPKAVDLASEAQ